MRLGLSIVFRFALLGVEIGRCMRTYNGGDGGLLVSWLVAGCGKDGRHKGRSDEEKVI
jgi:hypothetical protein